PGCRRRLVRQILSLFYFSGGRRHTRLSRDWSSDVCSSDLAAWFELDIGELAVFGRGVARLVGLEPGGDGLLGRRFHRLDQRARRSEERRVGKECASRWTAVQ